MTGLADVAYTVGMQGGLRSRTQQLKTEGEQDQDRSLKLARDAKTDTFVDETRQHAQQQWENQDATQQAATERTRLGNEQLKQKIEDEGALDFLYEINAGADPATAARRHNQRGVSRMDENSVKYDPESKTVSFNMDSNGDGNIEPFTYNVPQTIGALEKITGRSKGRYQNVPDGSSVLDTDSGQIVQNNPKDLAARNGPGAKTHVVGHSLVDDTGHVLYRDGGAGGGGVGVTKFNPQAYANDVQAHLGRLQGGKYDPTTQQYDFGGATAKVQALSRVAQAEAARLSKHNGAVPAPMIATVVSQMADDVAVTDPQTHEVTYQGVFDPEKIRAAVKARIEAHPSVDNSESRSIMGMSLGLGKVKPDVLKQAQDTAIQNALVDIGVRSRIALDAELQNALDPNGGQGEEADPGEGEPDADADEQGQQAAPGQTPGDPYTVPQDFDPAVLPPAGQTGAVQARAPSASPSPAAPAQRRNGAAPARAPSESPAPRRKPGDAGVLPDDAPPREKLRALKPGQGLRKGNVIWYVDDKGNLQKKSASGG